MWSQLGMFIYLWLLMVRLTLSLAITIREEAIMETTTSSSTSAYPLTLAKSQNPSQNLPTHMQRVRNAFVYEDADDVIHVIEPPKHFQELKKLMQQRQKVPSKLKAIRPIARISPRKPPANVIGTTHKPLDMEIQESEHLPVEILASVRKTEKFLRKHKPKLPLAQQRIKTKKIHTVIWQKGQDQQQFAQGHEKKINGIREFQGSNRRKFLKRRFKRQASLPYHPLKGEDLLAHINELVKNASLYLDNLPPDEDTLSLEAVQQQTHSATNTFGKGTPANGHLNDNDIVNILENSIKATDVIMEQIKKQSNFTHSPQKCEYSRDPRTSNIQNLRQHIHCMQNLIKTMNATKSQEQPCSATTTTTTTPTTMLRERSQQANNGKRFGERLVDERKTKDLRHKPFLVATIGDDYFDDGSTPAALNTTLIYDDVMTTIRNLLQATNLQNVEDSTASSSSSSSTSAEAITPWDEITLPHDNSQEPVDFHNLNQYLNSIQTIVSNIPQPTNSSLNLHEVEVGPPSKYYFINPQGGIYNLPQPFQHSDHRSAPPSTIFRQFPDIPSISEYLGANGSLLTSSQNVIEIL